MYVMQSILRTSAQIVLAFHNQWVALVYAVIFIDMMD